ncbi:hypothetical protein [Halorussus sp. GCM10023401]|uniref:hypothetical protein n=2 Tax=Halorussus TaxID=1070314 RepID=UPI00360618A3
MVVTIAMPSGPDSTDGTTRRRLLAGLGAGVAATIGGCSGRIPGTGPAHIEAETFAESGELRWEYPPRDDADGIGYAAVEFDRVLSESAEPGSLRFTLNSTVGGLAASEPYRGYEADWFRFRVGPPAEYATRHTVRMWVRPPTWPGVRLRYDRRGGRSDLVVTAPDVHTDGTITFPLVLDSGGETPPDRVHCAFTVQASRPGALGKTVRVSDSGTLDLGSVVDRST